MINYNIQTSNIRSLKYKKIKNLFYSYMKYYINQLSKLTYLRCFYTQITNKSILHLTKLTWLDCSNTKITDEGIKNLDKLIKLYCSNTKITLQSNDKLKVYK